MDLVIETLACRRGGQPVVAGFSARLAAGGIAELRGPNGVGKSTLLRALAGLLPLSGGDARLGAVSLAADAEAFQEQVFLSGHLDAVKPALTVRANLAHWAALYGGARSGARARVDEALARFGLAAKAGDPAAWCSAGQKRRLGLARMMVIDRPLWLLDEPTVSLDTASAGIVAELIAGHTAAGGMAVIATHLPLGLEATVWEMRAPAPDAPAGAEDPFLEGSWA